MTVIGIAAKQAAQATTLSVRWKVVPLLACMSTTELIITAKTTAQDWDAEGTAAGNSEGAAMRSDAELDSALQTYGSTVRRICFMHLNNRSDVEDIFQEVFLKYALHDAAFESNDHERAWLLRVAINACKDYHKSFWRRRVSSLEDADETHLSIADDNRDVLDAVLRLVPSKYRDVIYLHYYEGYKAAEIAAILGQKENTIYTWLTRAREQLKRTLGGELR